VREGNLQENLGQLANATRVEILVMDSHLRPAGSNVFRSAENDQFVTELERDANLRIVQVSPRGYERLEARKQVDDTIAKVLSQWRGETVNTHR